MNKKMYHSVCVRYIKNVDDYKHPKTLYREGYYIIDKNLKYEFDFFCKVLILV